MHDILLACGPPFPGAVIVIVANGYDSSAGPNSSARAGMYRGARLTGSARRAELAPRPERILNDVTDAVRTAAERRADTLARLNGDADVWVATASAGRPHLVPLSLAWDGARLIVATPAASPTARNAAASGDIRLALGTSRDVTIIEAAADVVPCADAPGPVALCYATRTGWDPRREHVPHAYLIAAPRTVRAWNSLAELADRTIMRDGRWTSA